MLPFPIISQLRVPSSYRVAKFIAGYDHIAVLGTNGDLYTRGQNTYGQLGSSSMVSNNSTWQLSMSGVSSLYGSKSQNTIVIKNDGTVWMCGRTSYQYQFGYAGPTGTAGVNYWTDITSHIPFSTSLIKDIHVFYQGSAIIRTDGTVWFSGINDNGKFGMNNTTNLTAYTQSTSASDVQSLYYSHPISTANVLTYLDSNRHIWSCGNNSARQVLGTATASYSTFQQMSASVVCSGVAITGSTSWFLNSANNNGLFCGSALTLQGTNSGTLNLYSATGNQATGLLDITSVSVSGVYGLKTTNNFWEKTFYSGGTGETPLMNNQSNRANWLLQHTMPSTLGTYSAMEIGDRANAYLLYFGTDTQVIMGIGIMTSTPSASVYEQITIPDF